MKITNVSINKSFIIRKREQSQNSITNASHKSASEMINLEKKSPPLGSIQYLQYAFTKNQQALGLLSQLLGLIKDFVSTPHQFEIALRSSIAQLNKTHPKYAQRLKNNEWTTQEMQSDIKNIVHEIKEENKTIKHNIAHYLVSTQNKQAINKTVLDANHIAKIKKYIINENNNDLLTISSEKTIKLLD
ncbi:MAG: hypothetical protein ACRCV0_06035 [Brevinema sp.]